MINFSDSDKKLKIRFFILSFAVTFLVLALVSVLAVFALEKNKKHDTDVALTQENVPIEESAVTPPDTQNKNLLFISLDEDKSANMFLLIGFDAQNKAVNLTPLPPDTVMPNRQSKTLGDILSADSENGVCLALSELLQTDISKYVKMNKAQLTEIIFSLGGVDLTFQSDISLTSSESGKALKFSKGKNFLDAVTLCSLIFSADENQLSPQYISAFSDISQYVVEKLFSEYSQNGDDTLFNTVVNSSFTNLNRFDYEADKEMLKFFSSLGAGFAKPVSAELSLNDDDKLELSFSSLGVLHDIYSGKAQKEN